MSERRVGVYGLVPRTSPRSSIKEVTVWYGWGVSRGCLVGDDYTVQVDVGEGQRRGVVVVKLSYMCGYRVGVGDGTDNHVHVRVYNFGTGLTTGGEWCGDDGRTYVRLYGGIRG